MSRRIVVEFLGKDSSLSKTTSEVEQRFGKLGGKLERAGSIAGKVLAGGIIAGGAAMVKFGGQASDLAETQSKVNQIFGSEGAAALNEFAESAAKNLGQSKQTALDAASTFGVFGKSAGLAGTDLSGFSSEMTTLASDMASFNNTSPEEAIDAIGAALRGESEPIRKYGVLLDDATLRQEAMKQGLVKTTKEALTPQQKVLAAQAVIMKQTTDQQGDFARTSDGLANKQRILKAQLENFSTELGAKALPLMVKAVSVGEQMVSWADRNRTTLGILVGVVGGMAAGVWAVNAAMKAWIAVTKAWTTVTKVATFIQKVFNKTMRMNPIGLVITAIALLATGLIYAYKKSETFRRIVNGAFEVVKRAGRALGDSFMWVKDKIGDLIGWVQSIPEKLSALGSKFARAGRNLLQAFIDGMKNAAGIISGIAGNVWNTVKGLLNAAIDRINSALEFTISLPGPDIHINPPNIPHMAKGGVVSRPTLALIGEDGPEAVVPLSRKHAPKGGMAMGGQQIVFTGPVYGDPRAYAQFVLRELKKEKRLLGGQSLGLT